MYNGESNRDPLIRELCGQTKPSVVESTGNLMYIHFKADSSIDRKGFRLSWKAVERLTTTTKRTTTYEYVAPEGESFALKIKTSNFTLD